MSTTTRTSTGSCYPPGEDLKVGSTVKLCHLTSERGKELNESVALILDELTKDRHNIDILPSNNKMRVQPKNLRVVCSSCHADKEAFHICSQCQIATYCDKDCQRSHWKKQGHKQECNERKSQKDGLSHSTWKTLTIQQRTELREHHKKTGCQTPWPVTGVETPAMLFCPMPCFLTCHPNMRFKVSMVPMPGGFVMHYTGISDANGERAPHGNVLPILKEDMLRGDGPLDPEEYFTQVPIHTPFQVVYAVIAEVLWTQMDYADMKPFYGTEVGRYFEWPGVDCIGICPGTGRKVPFSMTEKHFLVACVLQGTVLQQGQLISPTRIMPRILTKEGYERLMGPPGPHRQVSRVVNGESRESVDFYPTAFSDIAKKNAAFLTASNFTRLVCTRLSNDGWRSKSKLPKVQ
jgi:hypothetical protein